MTAASHLSNPTGVMPGDSAHEIAMKVHKLYQTRGEVTEMRRKYREELQR